MFNKALHQEKAEKQYLEDAEKLYQKIKPCLDDINGFPIKTLVNIKENLLSAPLVSEKVKNIRDFNLLFEEFVKLHADINQAQDLVEKQHYPALERYSELTNAIDTINNFATNYNLHHFDEYAEFIKPYSNFILNPDQLTTELQQLYDSFEKFKTKDFHYGFCSAELFEMKKYEYIDKIQYIKKIISSIPIFENENKLIPKLNKVIDLTKGLTEYRKTKIFIPASDLIWNIKYSCESFAKKIKGKNSDTINDNHTFVISNIFEYLNQDTFPLVAQQLLKNHDEYAVVSLGLTCKTSFKLLKNNLANLAPMLNEIKNDARIHSRLASKLRKKLYLKQLSESREFSKYKENLLSSRKKIIDVVKGYNYDDLLPLADEINALLTPKSKLQHARLFIYEHHKLLKGMAGASLLLLTFIITASIIIDLKSTESNLISACLDVNPSFLSEDSETLMGPCSTKLDNCQTTDMDGNCLPKGYYPLETFRHLYKTAGRYTNRNVSDYESQNCIKDAGQLASISVVKIELGWNMALAIIALLCFLYSITQMRANPSECTLASLTRSQARRLENIKKKYPLPTIYKLSELAEKLREIYYQDLKEPTELFTENKRLLTLVDSGINNLKELKYSFNLSSKDQSVLSEPKYNFINNVNSFFKRYNNEIVEHRAKEENDAAHNERMGLLSV